MGHTRVLTKSFGENSEKDSHISSESSIAELDIDNEGSRWRCRKGSSEKTIMQGGGYVGYEVDRSGLLTNHAKNGADFLKKA